MCVGCEMRCAVRVDGKHTLALAERMSADLCCAMKFNIKKCNACCHALPRVSGLVSPMQVIRKHTCASCCVKVAALTSCGSSRPVKPVPCIAHVSRERRNPARARARAHTRRIHFVCVCVCFYCIFVVVVVAIRVPMFGNPLARSNYAFGSY